MLQEAIDANASSPGRMRTVRLALEAIQRELPVPHGLERLHVPQRVKEHLRQDIDSLRLTVLANAEKVRRRISAFERSFSGSNRQEMTRRLQEQLRALDARTATFDAAARRILEGLARNRAAAFIAQLFWRDPATRLASLREDLRKWDTEPTILGSELNYVHGAVESPPLPDGKVVPAYADAAATSLSLDDGTAGREVELSPAVVAKAQQLGTTKAAWQFVLNEMRLDWYYGSLKGSTATLRDGRGNDADLAALLVSLLRAQGTSARFVRGTISIPVEKLADLMGLLDATATQPVSPAIADLVLQALSAAGISFEPVQQGGRVSAVRFLHVWVEAYVPYSDYRGAGSSAEGRQWIPLEPAIPAGRKYVATIPAVDAFAEMNTTASQLTDAWLAQNGPASLVEFVQGRVQDFLSIRHPGTAYSQVLRVVDQRPESLPFLPGSLPYTVVSVVDEGAFLPDDFHHQLQFIVADTAGTILSQTVPLHQVVGHRTILSFKPATQVDEDIVAQSGGPYASPAALVQMTAVVRVDGVEKAISTRSVGLGTPQRWAVELRLPGGARRRIENEVIAGNVVAIGVGAPGIEATEAPPQPDDLDGDAPRLLFDRAAAYENAWTESEEDLARLLSVVPMHPTADVAFVQNQLDVEAVLGIPQRVTWKGLEVDADLRSMVPLELSPGRGATLMRLAGYEGSFLEAKVLSDGAGVAAVSAATVLQNAAALGVPVFRVTPMNQTAVAQIQASAAVIADVRDQLARGRDVIIPQMPLTLQDWTGTGYIVRDPATEEGGYFLSGQVSGGQTIVTPADWPPSVVSALLAGDTPSAETDVSKASTILKVEGDLQGVGMSMAVQVGTVAPKRLVVKVLTSGGRPVKGVPVIFSRPAIGGVAVVGGTLSTAQCGLAVDSAVLAQALRGDATTVVAAVHALPGQVTTTTDAWGLASVAVTPDPVISPNATRTSDPSGSLSELAQVVAYAMVNAGTAQEKRLFPEAPFLLVAKPDVAKVVVPIPTGTGPFVGGLEMSAPLGVTVADRFGNPLAGQSVHWLSDHAGARFIDPSLPPTAGRTDLYPRRLDPSDPFQVATMGILTNADGHVSVAHIPPFAAVADVETVTAAVGAISASFRLPLQSGPQYAWAVVTARNKLFHGVTGQPYPDEFVAALYKSVGNGWEVIRGDEPDLHSATVTMSITDASSGAPLQGDLTWAPFERDPEIADDDDVHVFFRPRYLIEGGIQRVTFRARIVTSSGTVACCDDVVTLDAFASSVRLALVRVTQDLQEIPVANQPALSSDRSLQLHIDHASSAPLYLRITDPAGALAIPGPEVLPRADFASNLVVVPSGTFVTQGSTSRPIGPAFEIPLTGAAGDVLFEIYSAFSLEPSPSPTSLNLVAKGKVSYVSDPCHPIVTVSAINKDDSESTSFTAADGIVYAGSAERTTDVVKLTAAVVPGHTLTNLVWTVAGPGAAAYPSPNSSAEWLLGPIQDQPGQLSFLVAGTCDNRSVQATTQLEVGRRTEAALAIGFIDPSKVPLDDVQDVQVHDDVLSFFPRPPNSLSAGQKLLTFGYLTLLAGGAARRPASGALTLSANDATYILYWLFYQAANMPGKQPPATFDTEAALRNFRDNQQTSFKLFNQFQVKYTVGSSGFRRIPEIIRHDAVIGVTNDPVFGLPDAGRAGPANGKFFIDLSSASLINDGTPAAAAVSAFNTLGSVISGTYPNIPVSSLKWSDIGSRIEFSESQRFLYRLFTQVYPTYLVYRNRILSEGETVFQNRTPLGNFSPNPYPPGPAPFLL